MQNNRSKFNFCFIIFQELMISDTSPASSNSKPANKTNNKKIEASVLSEEDQLLLAIQNSLREVTSDSAENSPSNEMNGDSNDADDDGVIEIGFESDSDVVEVKTSTTQSWTNYLGDEKGEPLTFSGSSLHF